jgi:predicted nucleic acid-binding protein
MPDYVFDTTVLSNFAAVGRLELLEERYRGTAWVMTVPIAQWVV